MLEMKEKCESCGAPLPMDSDKAMICSYECTFCEDCTEKTLHGVCPNCKGNLRPRPTRIVTR
jgi:uncharacterized protein